MIACAVLGAVGGCYETGGIVLDSESEEVVPPCTSADAGADADAAADASTN